MEPLQTTFSRVQETKKYYVYEADSSEDIQFRLYLSRETVGQPAPERILVTVEEAK